MYFGVLLFCVPLQLFLSHSMGSTESNRSYAISKLVTQITEIRESWLRVEPWRKFCYKFMSLRLRDLLDPYADPLGECPAVEVFRYRDKNGYFGQSPEPRDVRPPHLTFRVGQVIKHKK